MLPSAVTRVGLLAIFDSPTDYNYVLQLQIKITGYNCRFQLQITITGYNYRLQLHVTITDYNYKLQNFTDYNYRLQLQLQSSTDLKLLQPTFSERSGANVCRHLS